MTITFSNTEIIDIIKSVWKNVSPYHNGLNDEWQPTHMTLMTALKSQYISLDIWMDWMEDPDYKIVFEKEKEKKKFLAKAYAEQIIDETLSWVNGAPAKMAIETAKHVLTETQAPPEKSFDPTAAAQALLTAVNEIAKRKALNPPKIYDESSIQQSDSVEELGTDDWGES